MTLKKIKIETKCNDIVSLADDVRSCVASGGVREGLCVIYTPHTTAALTIASCWDPLGLEDLREEIHRLIPTRIDFKHQHDTPQDAAGHIKSAIFGVSLALLIHEGNLLLGHSQGIYFLEFDGPRKREYYVKIQAD
jgi:secondary thiamine-phosphate synthase enzyme